MYNDEYLKPLQSPFTDPCSVTYCCRGSLSLLKSVRFFHVPKQPQVFQFTLELEMKVTDGTEMTAISVCKIIFAVRTALVDV